MKKILFAILALTLASFAQSPVRYTAALTATCSNANTACTTANSNLDVSAAGYLTALITVNGTYAGSTMAFEMSDDGGITYYPQVCIRSETPVTESSEVLPSNAVRSWTCSVPGIIRMRVRQTAYGSGTPNVAMTLVSVSIGSPFTSVSATVGTTDPCQNTNVIKSSVVINVATAATTALVAVSGTTSVYVCGFSMSISQVVTTANTILFEQGTGATCAGAPTALTGLYGAGGVTAAAPITVSAGGGNTLFKTASANGLCALTAIGASGSFQGVLTYVQQ